MEVWKFIQSELLAGEKVMLMVVVDLKGSTPGKAGFKMAVSGAGSLSGSVGGGVMEVNMVNMARDMLEHGEAEPMVVRQIHNPDAEKDRSGLLCSGLQVNLLYPLEKVHLEIVDALVAAYETNQSGVLYIQPDFLGFDPGTVEGASANWDMQSEEAWLYSESIQKKPVFYIFGGGHLSLPLSQVLRMLDFKVVVYDDRPGLNTMEHNLFAHVKQVIDYRQSGTLVEQGDQSFVAIMTVSHETDQMLLEQMLPMKLKYLGMIGSRNKVKKIFDALRQGGGSDDQLEKVDSPMGVEINSQTVEEIAISIAAKVVATKNK